MELQREEVVVERSQEFKEESFGIGDLSIVLGILRNKLYSDPIKALVQEVISNAKDANVESGNGNIPIKITIPTYNNSVFSVEDNGIGITPARMSGIFIQYGSSSKRNDINQSGGFGIGAKSPFAYVDMFSIETTTKQNDDLLTRLYIAYIDETQIGKLTLVSENKNIKNNTGTKIEIQVKSEDIANFEECILNVTRYFKVFPDFGIDIVRDQNTNFFENELISVDGLGWETLVLVNEIPYKVNYKKIKIIENFREFENLGLIFKMGTDVKVAANREELDYSKDSIALIESKMEMALSSLVLEIQNKINTFVDFKSLCFHVNSQNGRIREFYNCGLFKYQNKVLETRIKFESQYYTPTEKTVLLINDIRCENKPELRLKSAKLSLNEKNIIEIDPMKMYDVDRQFVGYSSRYVDWYIRNYEFLMIFGITYVSSFEPFKPVREVKEKAKSGIKVLNSGVLTLVDMAKLPANVKLYWLELQGSSFLLNKKPLARKTYYTMIEKIRKIESEIFNKNETPVHLFVSKQNIGKLPKNAIKFEDYLKDLEVRLQNNSKFIDWFSLWCNSDERNRLLEFSFGYYSKNKIQEHPYFSGIKHYKEILKLLDSTIFTFIQSTFKIIQDPNFKDKITKEMDKINLASYLKLDIIPEEIFEKIIKI